MIFNSIFLFSTHALVLNKCTFYSCLTNVCLLNCICKDLPVCKDLRLQKGQIVLGLSTTNSPKVLARWTSMGFVDNEKIQYEIEK